MACETRAETRRHLVLGRLDQQLVVDLQDEAGAQAGLRERGVGAAPWPS